MTFDYRDGDAEVVTLWGVRHWLNMGVWSKTKAAYGKFHPTVDDLPDEETIVGMQLPVDIEGAVAATMAEEAEEAA